MAEDARTLEGEFDESRYLEFLTPEKEPLPEDTPPGEPIEPTGEDVSDEEVLLEEGLSEDDLEAPVGLVARVKGLFA